MEYYKGRTTINDVFEMPNRLFHTLYISLLKKLTTDEGQKELANNELEEQIQEVIH